MGPNRPGLGLTVALIAALLLPGCHLAEEARAKRAGQYLNTAEGYEAQGLNDAALAAFSLAIEENPNLVQAYMGMGDLYRQQGNLEAAGKSYEQAAALAPNSYEAHYYLGLVRQLAGKFQAAVTAYLQALTINPNSFEANQNLASAYVQLGRPGDALTYAKRATELKRNSLAAWANLATVDSLLERYDDAVDAYRAAAQYGDLSEPLRLGLANAHIHLGHFDRARAVLEPLIREKPSCVAYERLGYVLFRQGKYEEALTNFRLALGKDANDVPSLNGLGVCLLTLYVQAGRADVARRDEGVEAWRRSLRINPDQPRIIDLLSRYQHL